MEQDQNICKYCYSHYSELRYPYRLRCKCVMCKYCIDFIKKARASMKDTEFTCPLCNSLTNPEQASKFDMYFSAVIKDNSKYQQDTRKRNNCDIKLKKKIKSSGNYQNSCVRLLNNLKTVQNIYNSCKFSVDFDEVNQLTTDYQKIEYLKRHDLLNMNPPDTNIKKNFIKTHLDKFLNISNEILFLYEVFHVESPRRVIWLGKSLVCRQFNGCSFVFVTNVSKFDVVVKGFGLFLSIKGDSVMSEGHFKVSVGENGKTIFNQKVMNGLECKKRYLFEIECSPFEMKKGLKYCFEYSINDDERILVNYNNFTKLKEFEFEVRADDSLGSLAYIRCEKIKEKKGI